MTIGAYLDMRCVGTTKSLFHIEAAAPGIPYPLRTGWIDKYAARTIHPPMREALIAGLMKLLSRTQGHSRQVSAQRCLAALGAPIEKWPDIAPPLMPKRTRLKKIRPQKVRIKIIPQPVTITRPARIVTAFVQGVDVSSDAFLSTYEWRRVRMMALREYGPKCQCCGATPATGAVMNVDHINPRKLFPHLALNLANLQILCHDCNHGKGNWDMTDWRAYEEPRVEVEGDFSDRAIGRMIRDIT